MNAKMTYLFAKTPRRQDAKKACLFAKTPGRQDAKKTYLFAKSATRLHVAWFAPLLQTVAAWRLGGLAAWRALYASWLV